jgi:hypothetical protein
MIVFHRRVKVMPFDAVGDDFVSTLGMNVMISSPVTKCVRRANLVPKKGGPSYEL